MLCNLPAWQHFDKDVSSHVFGGAIGQRDFAALNTIVDKMELNVDVLGSCMVVISDCKSKCSLIVTEKSSGCGDRG